MKCTVPNDSLAHLRDIKQFFTVYIFPAKLRLVPGNYLNSFIMSSGSAGASGQPGR